MNDPVTLYAERVLAGEIAAGPYVIWACERHFADLQRDDIYLDLEEVAVHLDFFKLLKHWKGKWSGTAIELEMWQMFIQGSIFGWKRRLDGLRRFRESYVEIPRKNGKTTIGGGTGIYGLALDGEQGAEIYAVATKRDQAKILWTDAKMMISKSPALAKRINCYVSNLSMPSTASKFEPLGRDSKTIDGLNTHMGLVDELHAWEDRLLWSQVEDSMGARAQPLIYVITTAGVNPESLCYEKHEHAINVLDPAMEEYYDDTLFVYIATVTDKDAFDDPLQWAMANPNLGVSKGLEYMEDQCRKAIQLPSRMVDFQVKHLNIWSHAAERWLDLARWKAAEDAALRLEDFAGQPCYLGLDLAEVNDMSALDILFPGDDGIWRSFSIFWCPADDILERSRADRVPYAQWAKAGHLRSTPGSATDFDFIEVEIRELVERFDVQELLYDRWKSSSIVQNLMREEVVTCVPFGQGYQSQSPALKEIERRLLNGTLRNAPNPVLSWNAANAETIRDPALNIKLNKRSARKRIDGLSAKSNAVGGAMLKNKAERSVYEDRGIIEL